MKSNYLMRAAVWTLAALLAACGGSEGGSGQDAAARMGGAASGGPAAPAAAAGTPAASSTPAASAPATAGTALGTFFGFLTGSSAGTGILTSTSSNGSGNEMLSVVAASRFLAQASFGVSYDSLDNLTGRSKASWINEQFQKPQTSHLAYVQQIATTLPAGTTVNANQFYESFWKQAVTGDDQLRQRMAYALSQIFVISLVDSNLAGRPAGVASYYDMLGQHAFGNFRDLLQGVALHPMMGIYLSHLRNQKESGSRVPDENFAREVMQLMSIGLYQLNPDGSLKLSNGKPMETYTHDDVVGMARVFTGWSWAGPDTTSTRFNGGNAYAERDWTPMQMYAAFHSTSQKNFLGTSTTGTGEADLKIALDTLFMHPNVGPFIGRQLIQRLVSSNPSPAYIGRVSAAFADNGAGVRGDMRAVIRAVLLDPEADNAYTVKKIREPVLRLANWMRAFNARSASGRFLMTSTDDPLTSLGQTPMRSSSVFNFYRPGYTPPNTSLSAAGMVAPEMQITGEPSVTGYLNFMQSVIPSGTGTSREIQPDYTVEIGLAADPPQLVNRVNLMLLGGAMSVTLQNQIVAALNAIAQPAATGTNGTAVDTARKNRVYMAIYLAMASPEYLAQR